MLGLLIVCGLLIEHWRLAEHVHRLLLCRMLCAENWLLCIKSILILLLIRKCRILLSKWIGHWLLKRVAECRLTESRALLVARAEKVCYATLLLLIALIDPENRCICLLLVKRWCLSKGSCSLFLRRECIVACLRRECIVCLSCRLLSKNRWLLGLLCAAQLELLRLWDWTRVLLSKRQSGLFGCRLWPILLLIHCEEVPVGLWI